MILPRKVTQNYLISDEREIDYVRTVKLEEVLDFYDKKVMKGVFLICFRAFFRVFNEKNMKKPLVVVSGCLTTRTMNASIEKKMMIGKQRLEKRLRVCDGKKSIRKDYL